MSSQSPTLPKYQNYLTSFEVDLGRGIARVSGEHAAHQVPQLVAALGEAGYEAGVATGAPASVHQHPAGGCGAGAGAAAKGRGGCCGG